LAASPYPAPTVRYDPVITKIIGLTRRLMIENDWSENERREYERYSVMFYLEVRDQESDSSLGQILDIGMGGLRLLSDKPMPVNARFHLVLDISLESGKKGELPVEATSVWSRSHKRLEPRRR